MKKIVVITIFILALPGCKQELKSAFDDVRTYAPSICTKFCEDKTDCLTGAMFGDKKDEAFSSKLERCIVKCAYFSLNGAYVYNINSGFELDYYFTGHVQGDKIESLAGCLFDVGAYICNKNNLQYLMIPNDQSDCLQAAVCIKNLGIDYHLTWSSGSCSISGDERLDSPFL